MKDIKLGEFMEHKSPLKSKTLWLNAIVAVLALAYPPAGQYLSEHPEVVLSGFAVLNIILRLISKDKLSLE